MKSRWSEQDAAQFVEQFGEEYGEALALRTYSSRLLGADPALVLHGGGNTSVKTEVRDVLGELQSAIFVKGSGIDLAEIRPEQHAGLDLQRLTRLEQLDSLGDDEMVRQVRTSLLDYRSPNPSIETLVHAFIPASFIDHSHADAILALSNQRGAEDLVREALGESVLLIDYVKPGFLLAKSTSRALQAHPEADGAVWMKHGLITWGENARESYERTIELVDRAEDFLRRRSRKSILTTVAPGDEEVEKLWGRVAPLFRGALSKPESESESILERPVILQVLNDRETLAFLNSPEGKSLALTPAVTSDHLIRTKAYPLWLHSPNLEEPQALQEQLAEAVGDYRRHYTEYVKNYSVTLEQKIDFFDPSPRVVMVPGLGAVCAGPTIREAEICRDITAQTLRVKAAIGAMGEYSGMSEEELFAMEYRGLQHAKLVRDHPCLERRVALVTGAVGAIGLGISRVLLENGCQVAITDLPGERLKEAGEQLKSEFGNRVCTLPLDVTDVDSVRRGFEEVSAGWGGIDLFLVNAGVAHVSALDEMALEAFRRLERVNVEGTLLVLAEAGRHLRRQGIGGDVVLISTKNVFAPGARFGAYSATKAAAHQLARIASLEFAPMGVRVNMVAPDAVFEEGSTKSGLWEEVGPDRMKARGLDEKELQQYYRKRNLLKSRVTARHVGNAVLYFAQRQSPTTGATIPVDGGLPDATPR